MEDGMKTVTLHCSPVDWHTNFPLDPSYLRTSCSSAVEVSSELRARFRVPTLGKSGQNHEAFDHGFHGWTRMKRIWMAGF